MCVVASIAAVSIASGRSATAHGNCQEKANNPFPRNGRVVASGSYRCQESHVGATSINVCLQKYTSEGWDGITDGCDASNETTERTGVKAVTGSESAACQHKRKYRTKVFGQAENRRAVVIHTDGWTPSNGVIVC